MLLRAFPFLSLVLLMACSTPARIVAPATDVEIGPRALADRLAEKDVVVFGEVHDHADVHATHQQLLAALLSRRPDLVIAMEMFERDVQTALYEYLGGDIEEDEFLARSRPWPNYATDYRPVIEFAREHGLPVLAANAPRELARQVAREGIKSLPPSSFVAGSTTAPKDDYWTAFVAATRGHQGAGTGDMTERLYEAQCLKDDTMAETIAGHVQAARLRGERPLVVLFCGRMHSDFRRGTVSRLQSRLPDAAIAVLSVDEVDDPAQGWYRADPRVADWVLVVRARQREPVAGMVAERRSEPARSLNGTATKPPAVAIAPAPVHPGPVGGGVRQEGERPALGLRPDYDAQVLGLRVGAVTEGGPAAAAGIQTGDVIVGVHGLAVDDIEAYAQALDALRIGDTIEVIVHRDARVLTLPVRVGRR